MRGKQRQTRRITFLSLDWNDAACNLLGNPRNAHPSLGAVSNCRFMTQALGFTAPSQLIGVGAEKLIPKAIGSIHDAP